MSIEQILATINYLANKPEALNEEEKRMQQELRQAYLSLIRQAFKNQIETIKIVDANGKDVTPKKLQAIQKEKGIYGRDQDLPERMAKFLATIPDA